MRILVVRIGRAGDMVMTTPAIQAILQCYPDATLTLLTSPDGRRLLRGFDPAIKDIWVWQRSSIKSSLEKRRIISQLKSTTFDKIFCFESKASIQAMFDNNPADLYTHISQPQTVQIHCAQTYLNIVARACPSMADPSAAPVWAKLPVSSKASHEFENELEEYGIKSSDCVIAIHPSYSGYSRFNLRKRGTRQHKLWPSSNYAALAKQLAALHLADGKHPFVIMDLLDEELHVGKQIKQQAGDAIRLINKKPDFERYKALLKRANLLVGPDTGPMHIAAAVNTRIVALFSGKSPEDCGPYMPAERFTTLQAENMPGSQQGISAITTDKVYQACVHQLNQLHMEKAKTA